MKSRFAIAVASMMVVGSPATAQDTIVGTGIEVRTEPTEDEIACREEFDARADAEEVSDLVRLADEMYCVILKQQERVKNEIIDGITQYQKLCVVGEDSPACNPPILDEIKTPQIIIRGKFGSPYESQQQSINGTAAERPAP